MSGKRTVRVAQHDREMDVLPVEVGSEALQCLGREVRAWSERKVAE
ncbi:hypothetical protein [Streptomyces sp. NPDC002952]